MKLVEDLVLRHGLPLLHVGQDLPPQAPLLRLALAAAPDPVVVGAQRQREHVGHHPVRQALPPKLVDQHHEHLLGHVGQRRPRPVRRELRDQDHRLAHDGVDEKLDVHVPLAAQQGWTAPWMPHPHPKGIAGRATVRISVPSPPKNQKAAPVVERGLRGSCPSEPIRPCCSCRTRAPTCGPATPRPHTCAAAGRGGTSCPPSPRARPP